jgi:predicted RNA binding protein YcfA (HicA-like mRNA interferase family)
VKLPRDLAGRTLVAALSRFGYQVTRQKGSHIRLTTERNGEHHITVPDHDSLRVGTLSGILNDVSVHLGMTKDELAAAILGS